MLKASSTKIRKESLGGRGIRFSCLPRSNMWKLYWWVSRSGLSNISSLASILPHLLPSHLCLCLLLCLLLFPLTYLISFLPSPPLTLGTIAQSPLAWGGLSRWLCTSTMGLLVPIPQQVHIKGNPGTQKDSSFFLHHPLLATSELPMLHPDEKTPMIQQLDKGAHRH